MKKIATRYCLSKAECFWKFMKKFEIKMNPEGFGDSND
jgi:hypothetical protein